MLLYSCWGGSSTPRGRCDAVATHQMRAVLATGGGGIDAGTPQPVAAKPAAPLDGRRLENRAVRAPAWVMDSLRDKALFAAAHNYSIALDADEAYARAAPRKRVWGTLRALQRAVRGAHGACDWVWYLDLDTVITAPQLDVISATGAAEPRHASRALLLTRDHMGLNTGAILARCGEEAAEVLEAAWATPSVTPGYSTQCAMVGGVNRCGVNHPWNWQLALQTLMGEARVGKPPRHTKKSKLPFRKPVRGHSRQFSHRRVVGSTPRGLREEDNGGGAAGAAQQRQRQQQLDGAAMATAKGTGATREAQLERVRKLVGVLEQSSMNSYPGSTWGVRGNARWRDGHFVLHLAGCGDQAGRNCEAEYKRSREYVCRNGRNATSECGAALGKLYAQGDPSNRTARHAARSSGRHPAYKKGGARSRFHG